jgi:hypothetical protein
MSTETVVSIAHSFSLSSSNLSLQVVIQAYEKKGGGEGVTWISVNFPGRGQFRFSFDESHEVVSSGLYSMALTAPTRADASDNNFLNNFISSSSSTSTAEDVANSSGTVAVASFKPSFIPNIQDWKDYFNSEALYSFPFFALFTAAIVFNYKHVRHLLSSKSVNMAKATVLRVAEPMVNRHPFVINRFGPNAFVIPDEDIDGTLTDREADLIVELNGKDNVTGSVTVRAIKHGEEWRIEKMGLTVEGQSIDLMKMNIRHRGR